MSLLAALDALTRPSPERLTPLYYKSHRVGWLDDALLPRLAEERPVFGAKTPGPDGAPRITFNTDAREPSAAFSRRLDDSLRRLYERERTGFGRWMAEETGVAARFDGPGLFRIQRAAVAFLGVLTTGVHLNLYTEGRDGAPKMWVARRSRTLAAQPGKLDQPAAGFLPMGEDPRAKLAEEAAEEAGLDAVRVARAEVVSQIPFATRLPIGLQIGRVLAYDLAVEDGFTPRCLLDEIDSFELMSLAEVQALIAAGDAFKFDSGLVALDFLLRHGALDPDSAETRAIAARLNNDAAAFGALTPAENHPHESL